MVYFGNSCKNAELREEHKNGTCKDIHNDESALALLVIGYIFATPFMIIAGIVAFVIQIYCMCAILAAMCEGDSSVAPSGGDSGGFVICVPTGFSD